MRDPNMFFYNSLVHKLTFCSSNFVLLVLLLTPTEHFKEYYIHAVQLFDICTRVVSRTTFFSESTVAGVITHISSTLVLLLCSLFRTRLLFARSAELEFARASRWCFWSGCLGSEGSANRQKVIRNNKYMGAKVFDVFSGTWGNTAFAAARRYRGNLRAARGGSNDHDKPGGRYRFLQKSSGRMAAQAQNCRHRTYGLDGSTEKVGGE